MQDIYHQGQLIHASVELRRDLVLPPALSYSLKLSGKVRTSTGVFDLGELTVCPNTEVQPLICSQSGCTSRTAARWIEVSVSSRVERTLVINPILGILSGRELGGLRFPDNYCPHVDQVLDRSSRRLGVSMKNLECSATCTCAYATDVENILDANTGTIEGQQR